MALTPWDRLQTRWHTFCYNFGWPEYVPLFDGWIARGAVAIPFVGYLILFNDSVAQHLSFDRLASETTSAFGLSSTARLKLIYLGLVFVGCAALVYRWKRPWPMRVAKNQHDFVDRGLKIFLVNTYVQFHGDIRHRDRDAYTVHGKYYDSEWEAFLEAATGSKPGAELKGSSVRLGHWNDAKSRFEGLLRSILVETFFREAYHARRTWLVLCILIATLGYSLLAVPSLDLFAKVMIVIIGPLFT